MPRSDSSPYVPRSTMTPPAITPVKRKQPDLNLGGKVVRIVVGFHREEFSIHAKRLSQTAFFGVHGAPGEKLDLSQIRTSQNGPTDDNSSDGSEVPIKTEDGTQQQSSATLLNATQELINDPPDYLIAPRDHLAAKAWGMFASWLYNEEIPMIKDSIAVTVALKAYLYARQYDAWELQNILLDRFRQHYLVHKVHMKELVWLTGKFGDDANASPLTRYILEQIAYDIATRGYYEFASENGWIEYFLKEGDRKMRQALFIVLSRHANGGSLKDPAENSREWKVIEKGEHAGHWNPRGLSDK